MGLLELFILAVALSMDAFAVSVCRGLSSKNSALKDGLIAGLYFGGFQALMPLIGYFLGGLFKDLITSFDHWVAFAILLVIGGKMVYESFEKSEVCETAYSPKAMLILAIATSIDALAVGITFAFLDVQIIPAVSFIGITTFIISAIGVKVGKLFGERFKSKAELLGGVVLIAIGIKILVEHLFFK